MGRGLKEPAERRAHAREPIASGHAQFAARLRTGSPLRVLNTSPDGMLVESPARLLPGRHVDLVLQSGSTHEQAPWVVVHSRVGCIRGHSDLRYRAGLRRAMGSDYPQRREARHTGNWLPSAASPGQPANATHAEGPVKPAVGTRFGRQEQT
jgi:hypothetical protein